MFKEQAKGFVLRKPDRSNQSKQPEQTFGMKADKSSICEESANICVEFLRGDQLPVLKN